MADCVTVAEGLAQRGLADPDRLFIRGGSAGGFTALAAVTFHDTFAAAASSYGIADLALLAAETHKFESRYLDGLVGPYPEQAQVYAARSPLFHVDTIDVPVLVLQGSDDPVVPPSQADALVGALRSRGGRVEERRYEGEAHGWRRADDHRRPRDGAEFLPVDLTDPSPSTLPVVPGDTNLVSIRAGTLTRPPGVPDDGERTSCAQ